MGWEKLVKGLRSIGNVQGCAVQSQRFHVGTWCELDFCGLKRRCLDSFQLDTRFSTVNSKTKKIEQITPLIITNFMRYSNFWCVLRPALFISIMP